LHGVDAVWLGADGVSVMLYERSLARVPAEILRQQLKV